MRLRGTCFVLPATVRSVVSVAAGLGGGVTPGAGGGGGGAMAYAQSGICAVAARSADVTTKGNAARTTSAANLRIKSLHSSEVFPGARKLYASFRDSGLGIRDSGARIREAPRRPPYSWRKGKTMRIVGLTAVLAPAAGLAAAQTMPPDRKITASIPGISMCRSRLRTL